jgi:pilus assembly protein CpaE
MNILLIEDNPDDVTYIEEELAQASGTPYKLEHAGTLSAGLKRLVRGGIDLVLTDLGLPDSKGLETVRRLRKDGPYLPIVVLTGYGDEWLGLSAVREGAQECLLKQELPGSNLTRTLRHAIQRHSRSRSALAVAPAAKQGMVIGFVGAKGGVGTSTVAVNVAVSLARRRKTVVAAEVRPSFGTFASLLKLDPTPNLGDFLEANAPSGAERLKQKLKQTSLKQHSSGLRVLFGPQRPQHYHEMEPVQAETVVQGLAESGDFSILDLPAHPSETNRAVLTACQRLVIVLERDTASAAAARALQELLNSWYGGKNVAGAVLVNRAPVAVPTGLQDLRAQLGCPILGVIPAAPDLCNAALHRGMPVVLLDPTHASALALSELAERLSAPFIRSVAF